MAGRVVAVLLFLSLISCRGGDKTKKVIQEQAPVKTDSTLIFNGKTLEGWEITNFGPQGPVYISGDELVLGMGDGCTGVTWKRYFPAIDYEVSLDAMRVEGNDFFCGITFPVRNEFCSLIVGGWGGTTVGISSIDGKDAAENFTTTLMKFDKKHWYHICVTVTGTEIRASIDSIEVVDFKYGNSALSVRPEVELSKPFGITSWRTTAAVKNIRLRKI
jgi:hypothetical protein